MTDPTDASLGGTYEYIGEEVFDFTEGSQAYPVPARRPGYALHLEIKGRGGRGDGCPDVDHNRQIFTDWRSVDVLDVDDPIYDTELNVVVGGDAHGQAGGWPDGGDGGDGVAPSTNGYGGGGCSEVIGVEPHGSIFAVGGSGGGSGQPAMEYNANMLHWNKDTGGYETSDTQTGTRGVCGGGVLAYTDPVFFAPFAGYGQFSSWPWCYAQGIFEGGSLAESLGLTNPGQPGGTGEDVGLGGRGGDADDDGEGGGVGGGGGGGAGLTSEGHNYGGGGSKYDPDDPPPDDDLATAPRGLKPYLFAGDGGFGGLDGPEMFGHARDLELADPPYPLGYGGNGDDPTWRPSWPEQLVWLFGWGGGADGTTGDRIVLDDDTLSNGQVTIRAWWVSVDDSGLLLDTLVIPSGGSRF